MARYKHFIDTDVVTEARRRISHIFDVFDTVVVMFSGGKDSLATLHMVKDEAQRRGQKFVNTVFRDEELIQQSVLDFVNEYRQLPWIKMLYFTVPLKSHKYVLGRTYEYIQWDLNRKWIRPKPEYGISLPEGDKRVFDQYSMDSFTAQYFKGKIAFVTGIRAAESIMRFRASVNKLNENYITGAGDRQDVANVKLCKPLFDWQENDIFKYFYDQDIVYCPTYDNQLFAGVGLRVSTPLHAESAKHFDKLKHSEPTLYRQVIDVFPEMLAHERYYKDLDQAATKALYGESIEGVASWIEENITDENEHKLAVKALNTATKLHNFDPLSYSTQHILNYFMAGSFKRVILPNRRK